MGHLKVFIIIFCLSILLGGCWPKKQPNPSLRWGEKKIIAEINAPKKETPQANTNEDILRKKASQKPKEQKTELNKRDIPSSQSSPVVTSKIISLGESYPLKGKRISVEIDLEGADLLDLLELIFKNTLNLNYIVESQANAKFTVYIKGEFSPQELFELTEQLLALEGISLVKEGKIIRVVQHKALPHQEAGFSVLFLRPKYLSLVTVQHFLKVFASPEAQIVPLREERAFLVVDFNENLSKIKRLISLVDEDYLAELSLEIYHPKVLSAEVLAEYLRQILKSQLLRDAKIDQLVEVIPIKELDILLILARQERSILRIKRWLEEIDSGEVVEERIFVYPVENGDAEKIAEILRQTFSAQKVSKRETIIKALDKTEKKAKKHTDSFVPTEVKIVPDKENNLLIIRASKEDYETIENILNQLDIMPRQVLIEALIAEVSLNRALEYGVEWFIKTEFHRRGREYPGEIGFSHKGATPAVAGKEDIFSFVVRRYDDLRFLLQALDRVSEVNILSSPVLLATNGKEALIQIGSEVPFVSREVANTSAETPNITRSIQYRDTGIILKVKPYINSSGLVKLDIEQEVSSAESNPLGLDSPLFSKRKVRTSLVVQNNQTVVLGGLIRSQQEISEVGVPVLKDIPMMGHLFSWTQKNGKRTELLIAITPRVVRNLAEAQEVMKDFRKRIEQLRRKLEAKS